MCFLIFTAMPDDRICFVHFYWFALSLHFDFTCFFRMISNFHHSHHHPTLLSHCIDSHFQRISIASFFGWVSFSFSLSFSFKKNQNMSSLNIWKCILWIFLFVAEVAQLWDTDNTHSHSHIFKHTNTHKTQTNKHTHIHHRDTEKQKEKNHLSGCDSARWVDAECNHEIEKKSRKSKAIEISLTFGSTHLTLWWFHTSEPRFRLSLCGSNSKAKRKKVIIIIENCIVVWRQQTIKAKRKRNTNRNSIFPLLFLLLFLYFSLFPFCHPSSSTPSPSIPFKQMLCTISKKPKIQTKQNQKNHQRHSNWFGKILKWIISDVEQFILQPQSAGKPNRWRFDKFQCLWCGGR